MFKKRELRILILVFPLEPFATTTNDHVRALQDLLTGEVVICAVRRGRIPIDLNSFDVVILHHSAIIYPFRNRNVGFETEAITELREFRGLKLAFAQDEYRSVIERKLFFNEIKLDHLFTLVRTNNYETFYGGADQRTFSISTVLPGYISQAMLDWKLHLNTQRKIHIGYRGRVLPTWMGDISRSKADIVSHIMNVIGADESEINIDLSWNEKDRLYGEDWMHFLHSTLSQIVTASGSSRIDLDGRYVEQIFGKCRVEIPTSSPVSCNYHMMSPRILDYAASGNVIIRIEGHDYDNILNDNNSICLNSDASNLVQVVKLLSDLPLRQSLLLHAQQDFLDNLDYHYVSLGRIVNDIIENHHVSLSAKPFSFTYTLQKLFTRNIYPVVNSRSLSPFKRILNGAYFISFQILKSFDVRRSSRN